LFDFWPGCEQMPPENAGQQAAFYWRSEPAAFLLHKDIADRAFRHFAAQIQEQHVVETTALCFEIFECVERALGGLVVERGVGGIGAVRRDAYSSDAIWIGIRPQRFAADFYVPVGIDHEETHFTRRTLCELLSVLFERGPDRRAVAREAEIIRRISEPVEMKLDERVRAVPEHRLNQKELVRLARNQRIRRAMRRPCKERCLQQTLAVLLRRTGVDDDAAADAHGSTHGSEPALELGRANGRIEDRLPRRKKTDGARVHAARRVFKLGEQLH